MITDADAPTPLIDMHDKGIGDVVVACWLVHSAQQAGRSLFLNPRGRDAICAMFGVTPPALCNTEAANWAKTDGIGHRHEYALVAGGTPRPRFASWAASLGLDGLSPVRPPYVEAADDAAWAEKEWHASADPGQLRVLIFPEAAWLIRRWPAAYFIDIATALKAKGAATIMVGSSKDSVKPMGSRWYAGFPLTKVAALIARADIVIANDSGPAHLAGTIGTPTFVLAGPTDGKLVFAHDRNVRCLGLPPGRLPCHPCHFAVERGYRDACKVGGCQALMTLTPDTAFDWLWPQVESVCASARYRRSG